MMVGKYMNDEISDVENRDEVVPPTRCKEVVDRSLERKLQREVFREGRK